MTARQKSLPIEPVLRRALGRGDFVLTRSNAEAVGLVDNWRRWPNRRLALCGPRGSGKTHLSRVFAAEAEAEIAPAAALHFDAVPAYAANPALVVEDGDQAPVSVETALFHLLNLCAENGVFVLLTGATPPARWRVALPDLSSRLSAMTVATLRPPDDALLAAVIGKAFRERGLRVRDDVARYLAARIERTFEAAEAAVARLDAEALARGRAITRPFAAELFG